MKKYYPIILFLSAIKLIIHLVGNRNYGFHRDELLHLSVSENLDWGYFEFPPFIAFVGKIAHFAFGYSLSGVRFFSTLAGIGILILCMFIAKELGGKSKAVLFSGFLILAFLPFYRNHTLFQPVAFDQFFWTLGFYFLVKYFNTRNIKFLYFLGITASLGLLNKYTFLIWILGVFIGLLSFDKAKIFIKKEIYLSALLAIFIILPNLIWQYNHHFPVLMHLQKLKESQLDKIGPFDFILEQIKHPFTFIASLIGLFGFFIDSDLKKYKAIGISVISIFFIMWIMQSKAYYFFAIYPVLFAAGAVKIEKLLYRKPKWIYVIIAVLVLLEFPFIPKDIPVLPIEHYISYLDIKPDNNGHYKLTSDYADMFGWEEQVKDVSDVYYSLSASERANCVILAGNYGEAGALKIIGEKYKLPNPICSNGSFWLWGPGNPKATIYISIGVNKTIIESVFQDYKLIKMVKHKYAIEEENNIPIFLCYKPKVEISKIWPTLESHVFD